MSEWGDKEVSGGGNYQGRCHEQLQSFPQKTTKCSKNNTLRKISFITSLHENKKRVQQIISNRNNH